MATKQKCEGKRRGFHRGAFGEFKCQRQAKGTVETQVGFTKHHGCCGDDACHSSIAGGYPAKYTEFAKK